MVGGEEAVRKLLAQKLKELEGKENSWYLYVKVKETLLKCKSKRMLYSYISNLFN
jgi:predicted anti-sigma-YlaC factor YlaD